MSPNPQSPVDLVVFTEEILNWKFHFLYSGNSYRFLELILLSVFNPFQTIVAFHIETIDLICTVYKSIYKIIYGI